MVTADLVEVIFSKTIGTKEVSEGSPLIGKSLKSVPIKDLTIIGLVRGGKFYNN